MRLSGVLRSELNTLFLFELEDSNTVEAVFYRGDTLCVSTQVGCAIRCAFCASGKGGLIRNLSADEIFAQYEMLKDKLPIRRIAIAGIGEPLMNWENVKKAFWAFKREGLGVSFYTTGHPSGKLGELLSLPHRGVSVSIHSLSDEKRRALLPHAGSLGELLSALRREIPKLSSRKRKKVSLAYLLLKGINDSREELEKLARLALELGLGVTLLYYNKTGDFEPVGERGYEEAFLFLRSFGVRVTLSTRFRKDPIGGCGTLVANRSLTR